MQNYSQGRYRRQLRDTYHRVSHTAVTQRIDKSVLVSEFLNLERFSLLKWSDYDGSKRY